MSFPNPILGDLLPPRPREVPHDLTRPSSAFRRSAWVAAIALLGFVLLYLGFVVFLGRLVVRLVYPHPSFGGIVTALPPALLLLFLVGGLFVVKRGKDSASVEVTREQQPVLFAFLDAIAAETGAPRPKHVYLSARVNASVFYDLSARNLVLPSEKNLEIGLGLVEVLTLDELKAVIAHEFGHFAQQTMAIGRWVYVAHQVAEHLIHARTWLDKAMSALSGIDLRVAWIGWLMRLVVWAMRAILDSAFRVVLLAQHALGRHMEFQADRVAVSVTGSVSLIHALRRLPDADEAWSRALDFALEEEAEGRPVRDLFALEAAIIEHMRLIHDEPHFAAIAPTHDPHDPSTRVFDEVLASPPQMWSTHPESRDRENHAKAIFLPSSFDPRPAFELFRDTTALREEVTTRFFAPRPMATGEAPASPRKDPVPLEESLRRLEERYRRASLDPRYRGAYLGLRLAGYHEKSSGMVGVTDPSSGAESVREKLDRLYPESLRDVVSRLRESSRELVTLKGLADGNLVASGGVIRHRGRELRRAELDRTIETVRDEVRELESVIVEHDTSCRTACREAALTLGQGWGPFLSYLTELSHFATHVSRSVADAHGFFVHEFNVVAADGKISEAEARRLIAAGGDLHDILARSFNTFRDLRLPPQLVERYDARGGAKVLGKSLGLLAPDTNNLVSFVSAQDHWARETMFDAAILAEVAFDALLEAERWVETCFREGRDPGFAPEVGVVPSKYPTLVVGAERARQKTLPFWDRFQLAEGVGPGLARFGAASAILLPAILLGQRAGESTIHVYNALSVPVVVRIDGNRATVPPFGTTEFSHAGTDPARIRTESTRGALVEEFTEDADSAYADYVYNVASAGVFSEWQAEYGSRADEPERDRVLAPSRFFETAADAIFVPPPSSLSGRSSGSTRLVLEGMPRDAEPEQVLSILPAGADPSALVTTHVRFEPYGSRVFLAWLMSAPMTPEIAALVRARPERGSTFDPEVEWMLDSVLAPADQPAACAERARDAAAHPDDPARAYVALGCRGSSEATNDAILVAENRWSEDPYIAALAASVHGRRHDYAAMIAANSRALVGLRGERFLDATGIELIRAERAFSNANRGVIPPLIPATAYTRYVKFRLAPENAPTDDESPYVAAIRALHQGQGLGALDALESVPILDVVAAAASPDDASRVERAFAVPLDRLEEAHLYLLVGLSARTGRDSARELAALLEHERSDEGRAALSEAVSAIRAKDETRVLAAADRESLRERAAILVAFVVAVGAEASPAIREEARAISFPMEAPPIP